MEKERCVSLDIKEAYKVLGVSENATDNEIEKQYMIWVRRNHAYQNQPDPEKPFDIEAITTAYNIIKHHNEYGSNPSQEMKSFQGKFQHFFHYYKLHMVGFLVLVAILGSIIQSGINNYQEKKELASLPPESLSIMIYGDYFDPNNPSNSLSDNILAKFPTWERVTVNMNYAPTEVNDSIDATLQQKSAVTLVSDKSDIYLMDAKNFERLMNNEIFQPLEQIEPTLKDNIESENIIYAATTEDKSEHIYGIVLKDTSIFNGMPVNDAKKIAAIRLDAKNKTNAMKLILELAN
jgi:hypothetical protein